MNEIHGWSDDDQLMLDFYKRFISPGDLCFDIGANVGNRTKIFLRCGASVIAIEPQADCARILKGGFKGNHNLTIIQKALGSTEGIGKIFIADGNTISSMSKDWIIAVRKSGRFNSNSWSTGKPVELTTLDDLIDKYGTPQFIKIDVEGYESEVIAGLSSSVKHISFEF